MSTTYFEANWSKTTYPMSHQKQGVGAVKAGAGRVSETTQEAMKTPFCSSQEFKDVANISDTLENPL